ncbi:tRNA lysidine(34) synthetase TilS [Sphingobacterium sp. SRCM116780]|uniref:tRNA lysidine(34) synthetase TilS n=1 Tax=Sphingobacterium sp. SRCM116780 TaxID=2907623 RepID=UPI001F42524E|nr:tRNA lysidine(34) synthetase TilS [Sphingobacterium sp. SRCM116780]UIR55205.1 tRNA lysidine(34) synthetase TilS [Sphingobacterium sp. SRCM116780]
MNLLERLTFFIQNNGLFEANDKILLTVSGGRDSMLMTFLLTKAGYKVAIAHCNFQLRGTESDLDESLVRSFAEEHGIPFYVKHFETTQIALERGISIQMAARELRYNWFEQLRIAIGYDKIAIAHHLNDHIETVLLNLLRGTGLQGLQGIQLKRDKLIRPLLFLKAEEVLRYVQEYQIPYRDDQSNFSTKYARNKVRIDIIPQFKKMQPDFESIFEQNIIHFKESYTLLQQFINPIRQSLFRKEYDEWTVEKAELNLYIHDLPLLYELFSTFGFTKNVLADLQSCWDKESGRLFQSECYDLLLDRDFLIIREKEYKQQDETVITSETKSVSWRNACFTCDYSVDLSIVKDKQIAKIDADLLIFPLTLRSWKTGDFFYPLGMTGRKKLSDLFTNYKVNIFEKENVPILVNGNGDIIWVVNYQLDDRYKISSNTKKVFILVCK